MTCACPSRKSSACCRINKKVCPALHESRTRSDYQQTKGGVGGLASPSTFNRKPASPFGAFKRGEAPVRRFSKQSEGLLPYTNERPGERRSRSTSERVQNSTKWLCHFVDTLSVSCWVRKQDTLFSFTVPWDKSRCRAASSAHRLRKPYPHGRLRRTTRRECSAPPRSGRRCASGYPPG